MHVSFRHLHRALVLILLSLALPLALSAQSGKRPFDVPAGEAAQTLKDFAAQAQREIVYTPESVAGLRTNPARGDLSPREALDMMLADTGLTATQDVQTGAFAVRRGPAPNGPGAVVTTNQRPGTQTVTRDEDGTIRLNPYEVIATKETGVINQGIIPREENQALRYDILNRQDIERSGVSSLPELFRQVSSVANFGTGTQATFGSQMATLEGVNTTNDDINLRGLGSNNTLVMINGRRVYESEGSGADISRIPLSSVERIEILPGSGSAIYGSSATAGVVNIVLRKEYAGTEVNTSFGSSTKGGGEEFRFGVFHGRSFNGGQTNVTLSLDYHKQWGLVASERGYYKEALRKVDPANEGVYITTIIQNFFEQRGTVTAGGPLNIPANPTTRFAAVPVGADGVGLTTASFNQTAGIANVTDHRVSRAMLRPAWDRYNFKGTIEHAIRGDDLGVYLNVSAGYMDRGRQEYVGLLGALTMLPNNPDNPFTRAVQVYMDPTDLPATVGSASQQTFNVVGGVKGRGTFRDRDLNWSIDASWSRNESKADNVDYTRLIRAAIRAGIYNPLRDLAQEPMLPAAEIAKHYSRFERLSKPEIIATNWRANGTLFEMWGGEARFSAGAEFRVENQYVESNWEYGEYASLPFSGARPSTLIETEREAYAFYAETTLPIVGERNRRPLVYALDLSAAARHEEYDDFGSAAPPMVAMRYAPSRDVMLRGSWSAGFQPPLQSQLFAPTTITGPISSILFVDPLRPGVPLSPYTLTSGGNPDLKPETSDSYDFGVVFTPRQIRGLTLSASYFRYDKTDLVQAVNRQDAIDYPDLFPGRVTRAAPSAADIAAGRPGPIIDLDTRFTNISRQLVDGWDFKDRKSVV
jgi:outer membrane receptor protein involved in Fe transport